MQKKSQILDALISAYAEVAGSEADATTPLLGDLSSVELMQFLLACEAHGQAINFCDLDDERLSSIGALAAHLALSHQ